MLRFRQGVVAVSAGWTTIIVGPNIVSRIANFEATAVLDDDTLVGKRSNSNLLVTLQLSTTGIRSAQNAYDGIVTELFAFGDKLYRLSESSTDTFVDVYDTDLRRLRRVKLPAAMFDVPPNFMAFKFSFHRVAGDFVVLLCATVSIDDTLLGLQFFSLKNETRTIIDLNKVLPRRWPKSLPVVGPAPARADVRGRRRPEQSCVRNDSAFHLRVVRRRRILRLGYRSAGAAAVVSPLQVQVRACREPCAVHGRHDGHRLCCHSTWRWSSEPAAGAVMSRCMTLG
eukprot:TRINITY_DN5917_c0_g1_i1.p2 TRINITY_DN5917_c0_g1~~TRINITY_DN5917_c0_g1_i1.p2  ORF type:complete len:283 (+),score=56.50 TRINITY_DN5917_c0_g1_i1:542-1390(+)